MWEVLQVSDISMTTVPFCNAAGTHMHLLQAPVQAMTDWRQAAYVSQTFATPGDSRAFKTTMLFACVAGCCVCNSQKSFWSPHYHPWCQTPLPTWQGPLTHPAAARVNSNPSSHR